MAYIVVSLANMFEVVMQYMENICKIWNKFLVTRKTQDEYSYF